MTAAGDLTSLNSPDSFTQAGSPSAGHTSYPGVQDEFTANDDDAIIDEVLGEQPIDNPDLMLLVNTAGVVDDKGDGDYEIEETDEDDEDDEDDEVDASSDESGDEDVPEPIGSPTF